ncbi:MAG: zinc dependent phospholipase C family protein [Anaerolineales bacterium]|nr:zinc dependent phospholipase C family protein [Anaerolineales bacterium]
MGTWICHLRIAEKLLEKIDGLDPQMFAIGNIAPDSGIPDENWRTFNPPKHITHFGNEDETWGIADLDFYRKYLAEVSPMDRERYSFLLGYFFHLITDNLWTVEIWRPHKEKYAEWLDRDADDFVRETKRDWYGLDFIYVRDEPHALFWQVFLHCTYETNYLDFMPIEAVQQRVAYIQQFYQQVDDWVQAAYLRPYTYLPQARMDQFVMDTTEKLIGVYKQLQVQIPDSRTILAVLDDKKAQP